MNEREFYNRSKEVFNQTRQVPFSSQRNGVYSPIKKTEVRRVVGDNIDGRSLLGASSKPFVDKRKKGVLKEEAHLMSVHSGAVSFCSFPHFEKLVPNFEGGNTAAKLGSRVPLTPTAPISSFIQCVSENVENLSCRLLSPIKKPTNHPEKEIENRIKCDDLYEKNINNRNINYVEIYNEKVDDRKFDNSELDETENRRSVNVYEQRNGDSVVTQTFTEGNLLNSNTASNTSLYYYDMVKLSWLHRIVKRVNVKIIRSLNSHHEKKKSAGLNSKDKEDSACELPEAQNMFFVAPLKESEVSELNGSLNDSTDLSHYFDNFPLRLHYFKLFLEELLQHQDEAKKTEFPYLNPEFIKTVYSSIQNSPPKSLKDKSFSSNIFVSILQSVSFKAFLDAASQNAHCINNIIFNVMYQTEFADLMIEHCECPEIRDVLYAFSLLRLHLACPEEDQDDDISTALQTLENSRSHLEDLSISKSQGIHDDEDSFRLLSLLKELKELNEECQSAREQFQSLQIDNHLSKEIVNGKRSLRALYQRLEEDKNIYRKLKRIVNQF